MILTSLLARMDTSLIPTCLIKMHGGWIVLPTEKLEVVHFSTASEQVIWILGYYPETVH